MLTETAPSLSMEGNWVERDNFLRILDGGARGRGAACPHGKNPGALGDALRQGSSISGV